MIQKASDSILIEIQYMGTIQFFSKFVLGKPVIIEQHEHYNKGSYRNRSYILGANGPLRLTVPLVKGKHAGIPIRDVKISTDIQWQKIHWRGISAAYGKSPFMEHFADELSPLYEKSYSFLFDFNLELHETLCQLIGIDSEMTLSEDYLKDVGEGVLDLRSAMHPKTKRAQPDDRFKAVKYPQIFEERYGFIPNLSVLDLLFCTGPECISILDQCNIDPLK